MRALAAVLATALLTSCAADAPPAAPPAPGRAGADQCGAADLASLIGRPRSEIPVPADPSKRRVVCTSCMVTQDYVPDRATLRFDAETGVVKSVKCG